MKLHRRCLLVDKYDYDYERVPRTWLLIVMGWTTEPTCVIEMNYCEFKISNLVLLHFFASLVSITMYVLFDLFVTLCVCENAIFEIPSRRDVFKGLFREWTEKAEHRSDRSLTGSTTAKVEVTRTLSSRPKGNLGEPRTFHENWLAKGFRAGNDVLWTGYGKSVLVDCPRRYRTKLNQVHETYEHVLAEFQVQLHSGFKVSFVHMVSYIDLSQAESHSQSASTIPRHNLQLTDDILLFHRYYLFIMASQHHYRSKH